MSARRPPAIAPGSAGTDPRSRIVAAGVRLVAEQGAAAATTRAIAAAAAVQAPTIFRIFGDKDGLLDAIAEQTMANFLASRPKVALTDDPVFDLRTGMEAFMTFGISNPDVFMHMYARLEKRSASVEAGYEALRNRIHRVALAGRLAVTEDQARDVFHAMARGTVLEMLTRPINDRSTMLHVASAFAVRTVTTDVGFVTDASISTAATTLKARLERLNVLSSGERVLFGELLDRIVDAN